MRAFFSILLAPLSAALVATTLAGCGAAPLPVAAHGGVSLASKLPTRMRGTVTQGGWNGPWMPTMNVLSLPVLDWLNPLAAHAAHDYVDAHQQAFTAALAQLPSADQAEIDRVLSHVQGQWLAQAGLYRFALDGTLTAPARRANQPTLLDSLSAIAQGQVASTVDRDRMLCDLLTELDVPARLTQGIKMTCEATSVQIMLAERDPAEYARLVAALASSNARALCADGHSVLVRVPDWNSGSDGWRSQPSRLLQPAFATLGNAPLSYSNTQDKNSLGQSGLTDPQVVQLASAVFGVPFKYLAPDNATNDQRMAAYTQAIAAGWNVPTWVDWATGHVVLAEPEQNSRVVFDNPFGAMHSMTPAAFEGVIHSVYVPASVL